MSCQIKTVSALADCLAIKRFLYPSIREEITDVYNDPWGSRLEEYEPSNSEKLLDQSWLQDCLVSFSPTADFLVLATVDRVVFLASKWDIHEEGEIKAKFIVQWESVLVEDKNEEISSVLCLPLASQKKSLQGGVDWTCIIVGFSSGYVKMYTETGVQLLSQMFHEGPVTRLNCRTYEPPRHAKAAEQQEELIILYPWAMVTIDGFSLYQTLRACRNQVARATASGMDMTSPPPLAYKKWGFLDQDKVSDCYHVGIMTSNMYDHLQTASLLGGFMAVPRNSVPVASLVLASGHNPFLAFYFAMEGSAPPLMSEVATAVASKLKSYLFSAASGFLGFSNKAPSETQPIKPKIEPASPLTCRFALPDVRRNADNMSVSPNKLLTVVTDTFGRVILVDNRLGIAIRMWKGYRDAQCGWLEVIEDTHHYDKERVTPVPRVALFLVIYAPRRGLLEVWTMQQGPRVAAFNVSKWARLVCPGYGLMGLNDAASYRKWSSIQCFLLDPGGPIKTLSVPFHYSLGDKNSKRAQSLHLLRKLKIALKECNVNEEKFITEAVKIVMDIKTPGIRQQAIESLTCNKRVGFTLLQNIVTAITDQVEGLEFETMDFESKLMIQSCLRLKQLLQLYKAASDANVDHPVSPLPNLMNSEDFPVHVLSEVLNMSESETEQMKTLLQQYYSTIKIKSVYFSDEKNLTPSAFLSCFHIFVPHLNRDQKTTVFRLPLELNSDVSKERLEILGCYLFKSWVQGLEASQDLEIALVKSGILPEKMLALLIEFCLSHIGWFISWDCIKNYSSIVNFITALQDPVSVLVSCNDVSSWWQKVRNVLTRSTNSPLVYLSSVLCRGIATRLIASHLTENEEKLNRDDRELEPEDKEMMKKNKKKASKRNDSHGSDFLNDWENISMEIMQWNLLVKQSEDLMILSCLLNYERGVKKLDDSYGGVDLSLSNLTEKGRGVVSELVSKWLILTNLDDHLLQMPECETMEKAEKIEEAREAAEELLSDNVSKASEMLNTVRKRFPFSLHIDVLATNTAWELAALWNKEPDNIVQLQKSVTRLHLISNAILKHGTASMIWHMLVAKPFTSAALLMEKVGKPPKERLCRRDIGISDTTLEKFLEVCINILDILMETNIACHGEIPPSFSYEDFWQSHHGPTPLVEVAASQKNTNYDLTCHHYQLALAMHFITVFNIKSQRPISFYDTKGKSAFFRELHTFPPISGQDLDLALLNSRTWFLCKVISAAVEAVPDTIPEANQLESACSLPSVKVENFNMGYWVGKATELAKLWNVDTDFLRRHHICELYSSGLDALAEEILPAVNDRAVMGSQLILLAGQRLYNAIKKKFTSVEKFSLVSPNLNTWLRTLDQNTLRNLSPPLTMTATLISHVINHLPEGHAEYQMALSLVDAVHSLMDYPSEAARMITNTG